MKKNLLFLFLFCYSFLSEGQVKIWPTSDGYIFLGGKKTGENFGKEQTIRTRFAKDAEFNRQGYVRFDLTDQATSFSEAIFAIYGECKASKKVDVFTAFGEWTDDSLNGLPTNKPARNSFVGTIELNQNKGYKQLDVTEFINQARASGKQDITFVLTDRIQQGAAEEGYFYSKENPSGHAPCLVLTSGVKAFDNTPKTYYIDSRNGNDAASGTTPHSAWKTLEKVESMIFNQGDKILFKRGCYFKGSLFPRILTKGNNEITTLGAYGEGENPVLDAEGKESFTLMFFNMPYLTIENLTITQTNSEVPYIRRGLYYQAEDIGAVNSLTIRNVIFRDIVGNMGAGDGDLFAKRSAGLSIEITGNNMPTYLDGYVLEDCSFLRVGRHGAVNSSSWSKRTLTQNTNWVPSKNIVIRRNYFEDTSSDGLIVRVAEQPLIEFNLFHHCSITLSGNACFTFNCDDALWQFNEARYTVYNTNDVDAAGFDSDYMSKNTVFQFNYAHHNEFADMLITGGPANEGGFNDNTIVRHNIFYNNGHHGIRFSGNVTHAKVYNNTIYKDNNILPPTESYVSYPSHRLFYHKNWGGWPKNNYYANNIYYYESVETNASIDLSPAKSTGNVFENNIIYANRMIKDTIHPDTGWDMDPLVNFPVNETNWNGLDKMLHFRLKPSSPTIDTGIPQSKWIETNYQIGALLPAYGETYIGALPFNLQQGIADESDLYYYISKEILYIKSTKNMEGMEMEICSFTGNLLKKETLKSSDNQVYQMNISTLEKGCYAIKGNKENILISGILLLN